MSLHIVYGCLCFTMAVLRSCNGVIMAAQQSIFTMTHDRKCLLDSALNN